LCAGLRVARQPEQSPATKAGKHSSIIMLTIGTSGTPKGANRSTPPTLAPIGGICRAFSPHWKRWTRSRICPAWRDVSIVVEESLQCGALAGYLLLATIGALRFCHDGEASTARSFAGSAPFPDAPGYLGGQLRVGQQQLDERADDLLSGDAGESEPVGGFALPDIEGPVCGGGQVDGASRSLAA